MIISVHIQTDEDEQVEQNKLSASPMSGSIGLRLLNDNDFVLFHFYFALQVTYPFQ